MNEDIKKHIIDIVKGLTAAAAMGALQGVVSYLSGIDWNHVLAFGTQALAAVVAIKKA